jgi:hypothetical protein
MSGLGRTATLDPPGLDHHRGQEVRRMRSQAILA